MASAPSAAPDVTDGPTRRKRLIQHGFRRLLADLERFDSDGIIVVEAAEGESLEIPVCPPAQVLEATYGPCGASGVAARRDVLSSVEADLAAGRPVAVRGAALCGASPPEERGVLRVAYRPPAEAAAVRIGEGHRLRLSEDAAEAIVSATYGAGDVELDVLRSLRQALLEAAGGAVHVRNATFGGDPAPYKRKTLAIVSEPHRFRRSVRVAETTDVGKFEAVAFSHFGDLCKAVGVPMRDVFASLSSEELSGEEKEASGKSGEVFWFSADKRFVLKTISDGETAALVRLLPDLAEHLVLQEGSLLTRYFGVFRLTDSLGTLQFVVMNNVFEGAPALRAMYDLKGTTEDRWVEPAPGRCLKDNNFAEVTLFFEDRDAEALHKAIRVDTAFLEKQGIMDYSMMCAMADVADAFTPNRRFSPLMGGIRAFERVGVVSAVRTECWVFLGLVDMLVTYNWKKKAAHVLKNNTIGWKQEIDTVAPQHYALRFRAHFGKKFQGISENLVVMEAPAEHFETPMRPCGCSGGTASFYRAILRPDAPRPAPGAGAEYWIAKDIARAPLELDFYERARRLRGEPGWGILEFMTPYLGVCRAQCHQGDDRTPVPRDLALLRNCRDGLKSCRMLDIKIGQVTAVAGWQRKSSLNAWIQNKTIDLNTNSEKEGFRLEGFNAPPATLLSAEDMLATVSLKVDVSAKMLKRFNLQCMTAAQFMSHFLDLHDASRSSYAKRESLKAGAAEAFREAPPCALLSQAENQELLLIRCIEQLAALVKACRAVPAPQQWIGSSVMLAFDGASRLPREALHLASPGDVMRVHIFDWGRSELNTPSLHDRLESHVRLERHKYWGYYCGGLARLLHECCRVYLLRFWHDKKSISLGLWDKDRFTQDDFIGRCSLPLEELDRGIQTLTDFSGKQISGSFLGGSKATVGVSLKPLPLPEGSRLRDCWTVVLHDAKGLPSKDVCSKNDVYVDVAGLDVEDKALADLTSQAKQSLVREGAQHTTVAYNVAEPVWEEEFEIATLTATARKDFLLALAVAMDMEGRPEEDVTREMSDYLPTQFKRAVPEGTLACLQARFAQKCIPQTSEPRA